MADFPSLDVACKVPGALVTVNVGDNVVDLAVSSEPSRLALSSSAPNTSETNQITTSGANPDALDPNTFETVTARWKASQLRLFARGLEACRNTLPDPETRSTLRDLSAGLSAFADKRDAEVKAAKEKAAEKKRQEAEKKAKEAAEKKAKEAERPTTPRPAIDPVPRTRT
jgi:hypothetical protein